MPIVKNTMSYNLKQLYIILLIKSFISNFKSDACIKDS